jgi:limonene-1,2-epoxide hydrolase
MGEILSISRRGIILTGASMLLASRFVSEAGAAEMTSSEKANVRIVNEFMKGWAAPDATGTKQAAFFTDDCVVRLGETIPTIRGNAAVLAAFEQFLAKGARFEIKILGSCAMGPVVINSRTDAPIVSGNAANATRVIGFFLLRDGKIVEQSDFVP